MGVNHRSLDVLVTEKFLNGPDVVAAFQELRGEGMTEGSWGSGLALSHFPLAAAMTGICG
jgi:hypothetical protein